MTQETDSKRIVGVQLYQPKYQVGARRLYTIVFGILYIIQGIILLRSCGQPYQLFLETAARDGHLVMEGSTKYKAQLEFTLQDLNDENRRTSKLGWFDWMQYDIEELAEQKKKDKYQSVLDSLPKHLRVPGKYQTAFWPTLGMGVLVVLHALVLLLQYWSVAVNVWVNYREYTLPQQDDIPYPDQFLDVPAVLPKPQPNQVFGNLEITNIPSNLPTHARIMPAKGKHVLLKLQYYPHLGMTFEYHRRKYYYNAQDECWNKIRCRVDFGLNVLEEWNGFCQDLTIGQIRFGPNAFKVSQPTFMELYKQQLLNPFSVFQIFCVLLWAIDDYIWFSFFNLFMVLMFEGTVVFQRLKSLQALTSMGNPSRAVFVYRDETWKQIDSTELLPGDLLSLVRHAPHRVKEGGGDDSDKSKTPAKIEDDGGDVVPADLVVLAGKSVVNEASLTGESVPQMKEGIILEDTANETLSMKGKHKSNVLYAGTKMLSCNGGGGTANIPAPPDDGAVCFVLRTGFASAQGKLVRMIEGSQEKVKGHERETGLLLLLLCIFAIISSSYVLYHGIQNENRSKYELLLHCILIVTNVIRPELPMQMAMAVNNSLMRLMKLHVFCTEPYRVPVAGKLNSCLFDKTGTLTTDELVAVGVCNTNSDLVDMHQVSGEAALVLAGCHSLVMFDDETTGDPLEKAALQSMRWYIGSSGHAQVAPARGKVPAGKSIQVGGSSVTKVEILTRHHFSSKLQRMSCVTSTGSSKYAVAKGSPEAIGNLLASKPTGYDKKSEYLSKQGYRVIALAYRPLVNESEVQSAMEARAACETDLRFAGFIAFTCMVRRDTASVLKRLKEGGMSVAMVTGDALLTAIHVAKEVHICEPISDTSDDPADEVENEELRALLESKRKKKPTRPKKSTAEFKPILYLDKNEKGVLFWRSYEDGSNVTSYVASELPELSRKYDLATTGKCLEQAYEDDDETHKFLEYIKVFARMTPVAKEKVIECLHSVGLLCMMCGDGANDVGALKQADVGVALLSGFSNINVAKPEDEKKDEKKDEPNVRANISQAHLAEVRQWPVSVLKMRIRQLGTDPNKYPDLIEKEDLVKLYLITARQVAVKRHDEKNKLSKKTLTKQERQLKQKEEMQEMQKKVIERSQELEAQGVSFATFKAMKEVYSDVASKKRAQASKFRGVEGQAAALVSQLDDLDTGDLPMIKLGDASIAAPFTSKMPSIRNCVDIVRQGRCTLVSSMQMYQIMALQCLISSYSLSALYLDGVKYGDSQMTAMGLLGTVSFMSVSRSKPLDKLSKVQPLSSIFHPALFISLLLQFAVHLFVMVYAVHTAKSYLPEGYEADLDGEFKPGILNTVVFLVNMVQQVTVFFVNLQGRPFMSGVSENTPLMWSLAGTFILTFMFASESVPEMNRYFQLVPFPDESFRDFILILLGCDLIVTFILDRICKFLFARDIFMASMAETRRKDLFVLLRTFVIIGFLMKTFLGDDTWNELIAMQEMMENGTMSMNGTILNATSDCVDGVCAAVNDTIEKVASYGDEF